MTVNRIKFCCSTFDTLGVVTFFTNRYDYCHVRRACLPGCGALVTAFDTLGACTVDVTTKSVRGGVLTREQFLPHEMRIVAALRMQGASDEQVIVRVKSENLFQYPTERMVANRATVCLRRLDAMVPTDAVCAARGIDPKTAVEAASSLTRLMASGTPTQADQAIFYSMICRYDIVRELVLVEVGERLQNFDYAFTAVDLNAFMTRFTTEYPDAARWTEATVKRIKGSLRQTLRHAGLIGEGQGPESERLSPLFLDSDVERALVQLGEQSLIAALTGRAVM